MFFPMEKYKELADFTLKYKNIVVALGMFDGLHIGHQAIIRTAVRKAQEIKGTALVFSFANHPRSIITPEYAPRRIASDTMQLRIRNSMWMPWWKFLLHPLLRRRVRTILFDFSNIIFHLGTLW